jgi:SAM-dependent methyltransferase
MSKPPCRRGAENARSGRNAWYLGASVWLLCLTPALAGALGVEFLRWSDLPQIIQARVSAAGIEAGDFSSFIEAQDQRTRQRVREGDLDALIYYALQSTAFTNEAPIEPALSAKAFVELEAVPAAARRRLRALRSALVHKQTERRLAYFADVIRFNNDPQTSVDTFLVQQYERTMRFLFEKEFVAGRRPDSAAAIAALYRERGLSTDSAIEAGYLVHQALATLRASEPARRIQRVLIVGPGLDLAPRTSLIEAGAPESYQPYAVLDSLVALGFTRLDAAEVVAADVNARVVGHLHAARSRDVALTLVSGLGEAESLTLDDEYRRYFNSLGAAIGESLPMPPLSDRYRGHLHKSVRIRRDAVRVVDALALDISTQRVDRAAFDLVVATNVFPYLDDTLLTLALANIATMLAPGGILIHNERRSLIHTVGPELQLPIVHTRTAVIATVRGSPPLYDSVFVHVKRGAPSAPPIAASPRECQRLELLGNRLADDVHDDQVGLVPKLARVREVGAWIQAHAAQLVETGN